MTRRDRRWIHRRTSPPSSSIDCCLICKGPTKPARKLVVFASCAPLLVRMLLLVCDRCGFQDRLTPGDAAGWKDLLQSATIPDRWGVMLLVPTCHQEGFESAREDGKDEVYVIVVSGASPEKGTA